MQAVDPRTLKFKLSPTQGAFLLSDARYAWLIGPEREGKTFAAICGLLSHQQRCAPYLPRDSAGNPLPMRGLIVRDTHANLKRHTVESIKTDFTDIFTFHDDFHKMIGPGIDVDILGMDDTAATSRIQGSNYAWIWIEEPAPIISTGNAGIRHDVFLACARRVAAGGTAPKRLQITMNPASKDHWTYKEAVENPLTETEVFFIKPGENQHISASDRRAREEVYRYRPDLAKRYDKGEFADVFAGTQITPEFNEEQHVSKKPLLPIWCNQFYRFWDGGLHPACVIAGISTATGQLFFLDSVVLEGGGMRQLIEQKVKPLLASPRYEAIGKKLRMWRDLGDATITTPDDSDSEHNASQIINEKLKANFEQGVQLWGPRREALKDALTRTVGPDRWVQINPRVTDGEPMNWVRSGFAGGYCYKVTPAGAVLRDGPDKNIFSHPMDAVSHGLARLFFRVKEPIRNHDKGLQRQRAKGYAVAGV